MNSNRIRLHDVVTQQITDRLIDEVNRFTGRKLEVLIDSPGGSVRAGYQLFKALTKLRDKGVIVTATITGKAASMASIIAMAANKVRMASDAYMMIHDAQVQTGGNSRHLRATADMLDQLGGELADIYAGRTKVDRADILELMASETFMSADQAVKLGFVDEVFTAEREEPKTLLDRISAMEKQLADAKSSKAPQSAIARQLETVARNTAKELAADRRQAKGLTGLARTIDAFQREAAGDATRTDHAAQEVTGLQRTIQAFQNEPKP